MLRFEKPEHGAQSKSEQNRSNHRRKPEQLGQTGAQTEHGGKTGAQTEHGGQTGAKTEHGRVYRSINAIKRSMIRQNLGGF